MTPKKKLLFSLSVTFVASALSPVVVANIWGYLYGRLIQGGGGAMEDFIVGWVAGLWVGGIILVMGLTLSVLQYRKS
jgi:hypothetical protein